MFVCRLNLCLFGHISYEQRTSEKDLMDAIQSTIFNSYNIYFARNLETVHYLQRAGTEEKWVDEKEFSDIKSWVNDISYSIQFNSNFVYKKYIYIVKRTV